MSAATAEPAAPTSYTLVLPPGWTRLPVREGAGEAVNALVEKATADLPRDLATPYRSEMRKMLDAQLLAVRQSGGLDLYLPTDPSRGRPMAASFVVSHLPPLAEEGEASADPSDVLLELIGGAGAGSMVSAVEVAEVPAVRSERVRPGESSGLDGWAHATRHVDYVVPVPGGAGWLLVAFSTPVLVAAKGMDGESDEPLAVDELLAELFDAVVGTLRWTTT